MLIANNDRPCGECTMCCQGHLSGTAHGYEFYKGRPCVWIRKTGCSIYDYRPENPCKTFKCEWKVNRSFPESYRPDKIKTVFVHRRLEDGSRRLDVLESGKILDKEILTFIQKLFDDHKYNHILYQYKDNWYELKR
jgi:hypothetical protein